MEAKYCMTREENIFVAKRNIIDYIWKSAKLEGLAVTYPDIEDQPVCRGRQPDYPSGIPTKYASQYWRHDMET